MLVFFPSSRTNTSSLAEMNIDKSSVQELYNSSNKKTKCTQTPKKKVAVIAAVAAAKKSHLLTEVITEKEEEEKGNK